MKNIIIALCLFLSSAICNSICNNYTFTNDIKVQNFIKNMVTKHQFDQDQLIAIFNQIEPSEEVIKKISRPFEGVSWDRYKKNFITDKRIQQGIEFCKKNYLILEKAQKQFGVPLELIAAFIGIETFYGQYMGEFPVFQSLATLAFNYPSRSEFFLSELEQFLLLSREQKFNILALKGSYAGAMGIPQFIASSYRRYAIDFAQPGQIDLVNNINHAIGSIANYLKLHGWQADKPIAQRALIQDKNNIKNIKLADQKNPKPNYTLEFLAKHNIYSKNQNQSLDLITPVALLELDNAYKKEYWLGYSNFYVITRYNHSVNYAMAVYLLSKQIKEGLT